MVVSTLLQAQLTLIEAIHSTIQRIGNRMTMGVGNITLVPFDHTYILYTPENPLSLPLAASSLLPILILVFLFSWHLLTREIEPCLFAAGHVCNDIISGVFKNMVKYPRPLNGQIFKKGGGLVWGMPSSHSQFMAFWLVYTSLMYIVNNPVRKYRLVEKIGYSLAGLCVVGVVVASRIVFEYHNWCQVIVGLLLGSVLSSAYYSFVCVLREYGVLDCILMAGPFKWWGMKDTFGRGWYKTIECEREEWEKAITMGKTFGSYATKSSS